MNSGFKQKFCLTLAEKKYMKALLSFVFLLSMHALMAQELERIWSTDSVLKIPESVLFDGKNKVLYVSNIDGA